MLMVIGRVTKDLEIRTSQNGTEYITFDLAENKGFGENAKTQFHQCRLFGKDNCDRIAKAKVQKGSLIMVCGEQDVDAYTKNTDGTPVGVSNVNLWHWEYVQGSGKKNDETSKAASNGTSNYEDVPTENCDDGLPV